VRMRAAQLNLAQAEFEFKVRGGEFCEENLRILGAKVTLATAEYQLCKAKCEFLSRPNTSQSSVHGDPDVKILKEEVKEAMAKLEKAEAQLRDAKARAEAKAVSGREFELHMAKFRRQ
jgi:hypothetical protein